MTITEIAQWLGYGVMLCAGLGVVAVMLIAMGCMASIAYAFMGKELREAFDTAVLRKTMRQLEADGKVSKKSEVNRG
ncbi:hypothetical protein AABC73_14965 [Pseudomonas sp. G.S.17]|uniref:hypothetical protein n=1 Tax=Pseudomonas sp. G.S.17 TaxID=3137451 RepID=UPI00311CBB5F